MVRAGCVFVADIHPSRAWTSGSFKSVQWNACVHRLDLGLYSHPKEFFGGMEFEPMLTPREKSPLPENVPRGGLNPRRCGQRAQALPTELFRPPFIIYSSMLRKREDTKKSDSQGCRYQCSSPVLGAWWHWPAQTGLRPQNPSLWPPLRRPDHPHCPG